MEESPADPFELDLTRRSVDAARKRAWSCVAAVSFGYILARNLESVPQITWFLTGLVLVPIGMLLPRRWMGVTFALVALCLAGAWFEMRTFTVPAQSIEAQVGSADRALVAVHGTVRTRPEPTPPPIDILGRFRRSQPHTSFDLSVEWIERSDGSMSPAQGRVRVRASADALAVGPGDRVRVMGWYAPTRPAMNPGEPDRVRWARATGDAGIIFVSSPELIRAEPHHRDPLHWFTESVSWVHARCASLLEGGRDARGRAMLAALLLGERDPALRETNTAFQRTGTAHLLAISGFHLAVLSALGVLLIRLFGDFGRLESLLVAALVLAVLVIVPARVPIVRAGVLVLALLAAECLGRRYDRLTILGWVTVGLLIWRPMDVFSLGAQLSVGITALLLWVAAVRHPWITPPQLRGLRRFPARRRLNLFAWLRSSISVCVLCWAVSLPIVAAHTGVISLSGALTTVLITPVVVVLLGAGYLALALGLFFPAAAAPLVDVLAWLGEQLARVMDSIAALPGLSFDVPPPSAVWAAAAVIAILTLVRRARFRDRACWLALALLAVGLAAHAFTARTLPADVALRIDMLSVSDGTCILVRSGDDALVWDCGSLESDLRRTLERAAQMWGRPKADAAFLTHANLDHYISLPDAAEVFGFDTLYASSHVFEDRSKPVQALFAALAQRHVRVEPAHAGLTRPLGDATLTLLWPPADQSDVDLNDRSLVARITVPTRAGERAILLVGDIEGGAMKPLMKNLHTIRADVLEAPHHGSFHQAAQQFVAAVHPQIVLQSTGPSRVDDRRWSGQKLRCHWLTTATHGACTVEIMTDGRIRARSIR